MARSEFWTNQVLSIQRVSSATSAAEAWTKAFTLAFAFASDLPKDEDFFARFWKILEVYYPLVN